MVNIIDKFIRIFKNQYDIDVTFEYVELSEGLGGYMKKKNSSSYEIKINSLDLSESEEVLNNYKVIYEGIPKEIIENHVVIHEFSHVFDVFNEVTVHHDNSIRENTCEYFAEYLSWLIIYNDFNKASEIANKYAHFRCKKLDVHARKSVQCSVEVIYFKHMEDFLEISTEFMKPQ